MTRESSGARVQTLVSRCKELFSRSRRGHLEPAPPDEALHRDEVTPHPDESLSREAEAPRSVISDWDAYWEKELADDFWRRTHRMRLPISPFLQLVNYFENSWRRVLVVGCGVSTEPALLARLGYEVVAFDVSATAIAHIEEHPATEIELANWVASQLPESEWRKLRDGTALTVDAKARDEALLELLQTLAKPNGSLTNRCLDFREFRPDQTFDVVYSPWSWQCLDDAGRAALPRLVFDWLSSGGVAYFATQNIAPLYGELTSTCAAAGLLRRHDQARKSREKQWPRNEREWKQHNESCDRDDIRMRAQLAAGAKMWDLFNASG